MSKKLGRRKLKAIHSEEMAKLAGLLDATRRANALLLVEKHQLQQELAEKHPRWLHVDLLRHPPGRMTTLSVAWDQKVLDYWILKDPVGHIEYLVDCLIEEVAAKIRSAVPELRDRHGD